MLEVIGQLAVIMAVVLYYPRLVKWYLKQQGNTLLYCLGVAGTCFGVVVLLQAVFRLLAWGGVDIRTEWQENLWAAQLSSMGIVLVLYLCYLIKSILGK